MSPSASPQVSIAGVRFTAAAYTYMEPHGVPSGGDWALERMGAVFLQGTQNVTRDPRNPLRWSAMNGGRKSESDVIW